MTRNKGTISHWEGIDEQLIHTHRICIKAIEKWMENIEGQHHVELQTSSWGRMWKDVLAGTRAYALFGCVYAFRLTFTRLRLSGVRGSAVLWSHFVITLRSHWDHIVITFGLWSHSSLNRPLRPNWGTLVSRFRERVGKLTKAYPAPVVKPNSHGIVITVWSPWEAHHWTESWS